MNAILYCNCECVINFVQCPVAYFCDSVICMYNNNNNNNNNNIAVENLGALSRSTLEFLGDLVPDQ